MTALTALKRMVRRALPEPGLSLSWVRNDPQSWLAENLPQSPVKIEATAQHRAIENTATEINRRGSQPLWEGYRAAYERDSTVPWATSSMERLPDQVRTQPQMGRLFAALAGKRKPGLIVEVGTAFGVSTMYWALGLQEAKTSGRLVTFDPNPVWHEIATSHLKSIPAVEAVLGTFEDEIDKRLNGSMIEMAFVDAIHTDGFVSSQIEMLLPRCAPSPIIVMDDISFSDDMKSCWMKWANDKRIRSSVAVADRVGILEFAS